MNRKLFTLLLIVILVFCLCLSACHDEPNTPDNPPSGDDNPTQTEEVYWGKLSGTVTENDKPIEGVTVTSGSRTTATDADGKYVIEVYSDGAKVTFAKDGYITQTNTFKSSSFSTDEQTYSFNIFRSVKVVGKVVDASGHAVVEATVTIGIRSVTTDASGSFVMDGVIGTSMMVFAARGNLKAQKPIFTSEMQTGTIEIELILR